MNSRAKVALAVGTLGSVAMTLYTGRHNTSFVLMAMFVVWVVTPFAALAFAGRLSSRRSWLTQTTLYAATLLITAVTLFIYAAVAFGPPRHQTAAAFLMVPAASLLGIGIVIAVAMAQSD